MNQSPRNIQKLYHKFQQIQFMKSGGIYFYRNSGQIMIMVSLSFVYIFKIIIFLIYSMELLKDPSGTRVVKTLPLPPQKPLPTEQIFKEGGIDWRLIRSYLKKQGKISKKDFETILKMVMNIFKSEPNMVEIQDPVTIVGDIHGQFYDLNKLLDPDVGGDPNDNKYLFLGDYVDRGNFSIEVLILVFSLKISNPRNVTILRGNHECRQLTQFFNFRAECLKKYDQQIYEMIMDVFDALPLACLINKKFLCVHGGISHTLNFLKDIQSINRFQQVPRNGIFCDLVWADPIDNQTGATKEYVLHNQVRGCSFFFGGQLTAKFLTKNGLISIIRAHEAQPQGFKMYKWGGQDKFPTVLTIFSAPNYCDYYGNKAAVIKFINNTLNIQQFIQSPHPYLLPNFLDLFGWSIPFLIQKISQMFYHIIKPNKQYNNVDMPFELLDKRELLQKFLEEYKKNVSEKIQIMKLGSCPDDKILETGKYNESIKDSFEQKKLIDQLNESRPEI